MSVARPRLRPVVVLPVLVLVLGAVLGVCSARALGAEGEAAPYAPPETLATQPGLGELSACPTGPAGGGEVAEGAAAEVRSLRSELAASCASLTDLLRLLVARSWWSTAQLLQGQHDAHVDAEASASLLSSVASSDASSSESLAELVEGSGASSSVRVANASELTGPVTESVDASGEAQRSALWFLIGAVCSLLVGFAVWRVGSIRG